MGQSPLPSVSPTEQRCPHSALLDSRSERPPLPPSWGGQRSLTLLLRQGWLQGADLSGLGGGAAVVFASGFLNPSANQNGAAFGLFAALPDGNVAELPAVVPTARLQVIHNAADPGANEVDVYINGNLELDNFAFRTATPFIDVPAGVTLNIGIAPGNSTSVDDTIKNFPVQFENGETYVAVANGLIDTTGFAPNPDGRDIFFTIFAKDDIREKGESNHKVDFIE